MSTVRNLYFASCVHDGGIYQYTYNGIELSILKKIYPCDKPMYLLREGRFLFALLRAPFGDGKDSGILPYEVGDDGSLRRCGDILPTRGLVACHLSFWRGHIYVANYMSGSVFRDDGLLATHKGKGPDPGRQEGPHPHMAAPSPDGSCLLVTDLGMDRIFSYDEDLREISSVQAPAGSGPRHFSVLDRSHIAVVNELACSISWYFYEGGKLTLGETLPLLPSPVPGATAAAVRTVGTTVYASVRGADAVSVFRWEHETLSPVQTVACGGDSPRDIIVAGGRLWCMNENTSTVTCFSLCADGKIGEMRREPLAIPHVLAAVVG